MIFSALFWQSGVFSMYFVFLLLFIFVSLRFPPCCCNWMLVSTLSVKMFHFSNILGSPKAVKPSMKHRCIFSCGGGGEMGVIYLQLQSSRAKTTNRICLNTHTPLPSLPLFSTCDSKCISSVIVCRRRCRCCFPPFCEAIAKTSPNYKISSSQ